MSMPTEKKIAEDLVMAVLEMADAVQRARAHMGATGRDAVGIVGHIVAALRSAGGHLPPNLHELRWPFEERPQPKEDPTGLKAAMAIADVLGRAMLLKSGDDQLADDVAKVWPEHGKRADAERALEQLRQERTAQRVASAKPIPPRPSAPAPGAKDEELDMPLVDAPPGGPPGSWVDGEYKIETFTRQPLVG